MCHDDVMMIATQIFWFAKFEKVQKHRLTMQLGHSFPIEYPWITTALPTVFHL